MNSHQCEIPAPSRRGGTFRDPAFRLPAWAETPADTLVEAFAIDDVITLDPAEAFELTMGEINGNTYDKLVRLDINDPSKIVG